MASHLGMGRWQRERSLGAENRGRSVAPGPPGGRRGDGVDDRQSSRDGKEHREQWHYWIGRYSQLRREGQPGQSPSGRSARESVWRVIELNL